MVSFRFIEQGYVVSALGVTYWRYGLGDGGEDQREQG